MEQSKKQTGESKPSKIEHLEDAVANLSERYKLLEEVVSLVSISDYDILLGEIMKRSMEKTKADNGSIFFLDLSTKELYPEIVRGQYGIKDTKLRLGEGFIGKSAQDGTAYITNNIKDDPLHAQEKWIEDISGYIPNAILAAPFTNSDRVTGALELTKKDGTFSQEDIESIRHITSTPVTNTLELLRTSIIDHLTKAYNKKYGLTRLEQEFIGVSRFKLPLSLIMFDIDYFKKINDTYGHPVGDFVLKKLSEITSQKIRRTDVLCRYGGEEFMIILQGTNREGLAHVGENVRNNIERYDFQSAHPQLKLLQNVTISLGGATYTGTEFEDYNGLLKKADEKLYEAKSRGRNQLYL